MAISPASGALSQTQLAALQQIRALRAAKPAASTQATTQVPSAAPVPAKPVAVQQGRTQPLATAAAVAGSMPANRPRGSILNITV